MTKSIKFAIINIEFILKNMFKKKRIIWLIVLIFLLTASYFLTPQISNYFKWKNAVEASAGFPYQIGLIQAITIECVPEGEVCVGGTLCIIKDVAECKLYSDVSGTPSGGMGFNALFSRIAISQAGLTPGGQLIAGGMSNILMDNGVLASSGGCYGCYAKVENIKDKIVNWFDYIIAGFKDN